MRWIPRKSLPFLSACASSFARKKSSTMPSSPSSAFSHEALMFSLVLSLFTAGCDRESDKNDELRAPSEVTVLRVESSSPEQPGAEHCKSGGKECKPLAPKQRLKPTGLVRTFAGGKVSLDFGGGRRLDLDGLSQVELSEGKAQLRRGEFSVDTSPLIEKEQFEPLQITAGGKSLTSPRETPTRAAFLVGKDDTVVTVQRGQMLGVEPELGAVGQSFRLASSQVFRTALGGEELAAQRMVAPRTGEFGKLLSSEPRPTRGLGTMSARVPNTTETRTGVQLKNHQVRVIIRDGYAQTTVEEEFENTSAAVLEGRYRFPVPGDASLSRLALWVGDALIEGEVLERTRARGIYESIVDRPVPRDPALLEWVTGGEMSLKVFPILPKKSRRVVLAYNQVLSTEGGALRYVYPLSLGQGRETNIKRLSIQVHATDSAGKLRDLRISGYDAKLGREGPWHTLSYEAENIAPNQDFVLQMNRDSAPGAQLAAYVPEWGASAEPPVARADAATPRAEPAGEPDEAGHFAVRITANLPEGMKRPAPRPIDRAIVIDVSHSQSQRTLRAQAALAFGILRDSQASENTALLACDSACSVFSPGSLETSPEQRLERARDWLQELTPGGSSDVSGALVAGAKRLAQISLSSDRRTRQLIYLGDGQASSGDLTVDSIARRAAALLEREKLDVRFIGAGRTLDEDMLQGLASRLGATLDLLRAGSALEARISELTLSLRRPVLRDARLSLPPGLRSDDIARLPALRLGQQWVLTGRIHDFSGGEIVLSGNWDGLPYRQSQAVKLRADHGAQNPLVPRLWARAQIRRMQAAPPSPENDARIVELSRKYRTMSRLTSFLVLESEEMYEQFGVERTTDSKRFDSGASFSLEATRADLDGEESVSKELTSFEELESGSPAAPGLREEAQRKSARLSTKGAFAAGDLGDQGNMWGPRGSASASGGGKARTARPMSKSAPKPKSKPVARSSGRKRRFRDGGFCPPGDPMCSRIPSRRPPPRPRRRRAHLTHQTMDDAWRTWAAGDLETLRAKLHAAPESRASHEAYIRALIEGGRFKDALRVSTDFVALDPDHARARELLSYAAVVNGDHELARQMVDVRTETSPRDISAHTEAARSFEAVGDAVRACAHYRSLAELAPRIDEAKQRARECWQEMLGSVVGTVGTTKVKGKPGQLQVEVRCDDSVKKEDCPSPAVITPDGRVVSPWTPGVGASSRNKVTFVKLRSGFYYVLVLGGSPEARGKVHLTGRFESRVIPFDGGTMHTVAKTGVEFR